MNWLEKFVLYSGIGWLFEKISETWGDESVSWLVSFLIIGIIALIVWLVKNSVFIIKL